MRDFLRLRRMTALWPDPANTSLMEPASLLTATWVNAQNMESTVVKDGFDQASAICAIAGAALCTANNIS